MSDKVDKSINYIGKKCENIFGVISQSLVKKDANFCYYS